MRGTDMKEKILTDKKYGLRDYLYIPFSIYPFGCLLKLLTKLVSALLPALQVLTMAAFIDRVTLVVQGKAGGTEVYVPLLLLACILAFTYLNGQLIAFLNLKTELRLAGTYETALLDKRGKLEYWHIENDDSLSRRNTSRSVICSKVAPCQHLRSYINPFVNTRRNCRAEH